MNPGCGPLPRRPRGRARRRRGGALHHQPQLQGPHGQPELRGLPLLARRSPPPRPHRRHHRSAEGGVSHGQGRLRSSATTSRPTSSIRAATWRPCCRPRRRSSPSRTTRSSTRSSRRSRCRRAASSWPARTSAAAPRASRPCSCLKGYELTIVAQRLRAHLPAELHQPRPATWSSAPDHRGRARATSWRSRATRSSTRRPGKSFAVVPLPKARQAIIDAGGLIAYTRKRVMEAAGRA